MPQSATYTRVNKRRASRPNTDQGITTERKAYTKAASPLYHVGENSAVALKTNTDEYTSSC
jgi:hypothetical protein